MNSNKYESVKGEAREWAIMNSCARRSAITDKYLCINSIKENRLAKIDEDE